MALVKQIATLVNDSVKEALGKNASLSTLDTTDIVSLGKAISEYDAYEKFYGALVNRIIKTVYFVRTYKEKSRSVLRDENEYGAFIQKVYTEMPDAVDNASWAVSTVTQGVRSYEQASPYDVENVIKVTAIIYGGQGTWSQEFIYSLEELKTAFTNEAGMMSLIDAIYRTADNAIKLEIERLEADAVNTSMAKCIKEGLARNLLSEYNTKHPTNTLTVAQAMEDVDFLKYATKEIKRAISNMGNMNVNFNVDGYATYTPKENLVVEMLSEFASATATYLEADTYHNELLALPKYDEVTFWQSPGNTANFSFDKCSSIKVQHDDIDDEAAVAQSGIICFVHDTENVACYFGRRTTWELPNPRSEVMIHGEKARKGYAIDTHANAFVFYIEDPAPEPSEIKKAAKAK